MDDKRVIEAGSIPRAQAIFQWADQLHMRVGLVDLPGVRVKGAGHCRHPTFARTVHAGGDHTPMTAVHTIEVADGHHGGEISWHLVN